MLSFCVLIQLDKLSKVNYFKVQFIQVLRVTVELFLQYTLIFVSECHVVVHLNFEG